MKNLFLFIFLLIKREFSINATAAENGIYWAPVDTFYVFVLTVLCIGFCYLQCLYCIVTQLNRYGFTYFTLN